MEQSSLTVASGRPTVMGRRWMISSTHYLATLAGARAFEAGGNAVDAGIAAGVALTVVERDMADFGGVAPMMILTPAMDAPITLDGLGRWPRSLTLERYESLLRHGYDDALRWVTPGAPDAYLTALERYGRLRLADVLAPAVELAGGFPVFPRLASAIRKWHAGGSVWPSSASVFLPHDRPPSVGDVLVQAELGALLTRLIDVERQHTSADREGAIRAARMELYEGEVADRIVAFVRDSGGGLLAEDLAAARVREEPAIHSTYRGADVYACGPWSQGPLVPMTLNVLERFDMSARNPLSAEFVHLFAEAFKLASADREGFFGDPDHIDVPIGGLLSKDYAEVRSRDISGYEAFPSLRPPGDPWPFEGRHGPPGYRPAGPVTADHAQRALSDTAFVCAIDADGTAFAATPSDDALTSPLVPGLGFAVSSRGTQLWREPRHPSAIGPGKRPRLTPNPAMVLNDRSVMPFGCPGGDAQCQAMVQVVSHLLDHGMDLQEAIEMPRAISRSFPASFEPHTVRLAGLDLEPRFTAATQRELSARGHELTLMKVFDPEAAAVCAVVTSPTGVIRGGADPRRECYAIGW